MNPKIASPDTEPDLVADAEQKDAQSALRARLEEIRSGIIGSRDEWIAYRARSGVESKWLKCEALYEGNDVDESTGMEDTLTNGPKRRNRKGRSAEPIKSRVTINIVRDKCDTQVARHCEILLPTDDSNWGIRTTPIPELADKQKSQAPAMVTGPTGQLQPLTDQQGQPMTEAQAAQAVIDKASKAAQAMEDEIADNLVECHFNGEERKVITSGVRLGTGVLKGPFPFKQKSKVWMVGPGGRGVAQTNESIIPASKQVGVWNVYPDPSCGNDVKRGKGIWEYRPITAKELRAFVGMKGFIDEAIREVLKGKPQKVAVVGGKPQLVPSDDGSYQLWEYHGEVDPEDMGILSEQAKDPLEVRSGVLVICNDIVIGAQQSFNPDEPIPYDFWCWRERDDTPFGDGFPLECEHQQRVINAAWRMLMDTGRNAAGIQLVYKPEAVSPADGNEVITPNKAWHAGEDVEDIRQVFGVYHLGQGLKEMMEVVKFAMEANEKETNTPAIMQGQQGVSPETLGGLQMAMAQASAPQRQRIKRFDDCITVPHIGRYYDWHMANSEKMEIKGDFEVDARGSSVLIERDIQNAQAMGLAQIVQMPLFAPRIKEKWALETILKGFFKVNPADAMKTDAEYERDIANAPQQKDPRIEAAEITLLGKREELADRKDDRKLRAAIERQNATERAADRRYNTEREQSEYVIAMTEQQNERDQFFAKLAHERNLSVDQLMAQWNIKRLDIDNERQMFNAEVAVKSSMGSGI